MKRSFQVDEILLGDVSGQVLGTITVDPQWGVIESIECQVFEFSKRRTDSPVELDVSLRRAAREIVEALLARDPEVFDLAGPLMVSGENASLQRTQDSAGQRTLAEFLSSPEPGVRRSLRRAE